jgi:sulfite exporter TauE/SafE
MLASISPVGEASRRQRWTITVSAYLVMSTVGGLLWGAAFGGVGALIGVDGWGRWSLVALAIACLVGATLDAVLAPGMVPSWRRQVDERWLTTYRGWVYGAGFGFQLGLGVVTIITSALTYVALLAALLTGSVLQGALVGATFGLVRSVPLLLVGGVRTPQRLQRLHRRLDEATGLVHRGAVGGQVALGVVAAVTAARTGAL